MNRPKHKRFIPVLLLDGVRLVKTIGFKNPVYLGDPINAVKIFNDKGADELAILDINCSKNNSEIQWSLLQDIASEAFMPMSYGGGINTLEKAKEIFKIGFEKIILNSILHTEQNIITEISQYSGNQSVVVCVDYKKNIFGKKILLFYKGSKASNLAIDTFVKKCEELGAGEIILQSIDNDGKWCGYDIDLLKRISSLSSVPIIPLGGCGNNKHFVEALNNGAHAVAAGSFFVFSGKNKGILINYEH